MTKHGVTVYMPDGMKPALHIPRYIVQEWMIYGMIGYRDHNSEWGCAVKSEREGDYGPITVTDYHLYHIDASGAYWESLKGQREEHARMLIEEGKEDEMHLWNGLFHTHPIGSSATMSGTDMDQLKELAGQNYWGISIICPANREAAIHPDKFLYHYADCRQFDNGMLVVDNLVPEIEAAPAVDPYAEFTDVMGQIMHKRKVTPKHYGNRSKDIDRILTDVNDTYDESMMLIDRMMTTNPHDFEPGDWVYIHSISRDGDLMASYSLEDQEKLNALEHTVCKIEMSTSGSISVGGMWLSPQESEHDTDPFVDFVYRVAQKGTPKAAMLNNQKTATGAVVCTKKLFIDAGIKDMYDHCKNTVKNTRKVKS